MPRRRSSRELLELPAPLRDVIRAAVHECPAGHANALRDLTRLAARKVPARGIFDPTVRGEEDMFAEIDAIANRHLGRRGARAAWRAALRAAPLDLEGRDRIERAALRVETASDTVHFYTGLAFGLIWLARRRDG